MSFSKISLNKAFRNLLPFVLLVFSSAQLRAQISATPMTGCAPLLVEFKGVPGTTNPTWDFGDGSGATKVDASKTYTKAGTYNAVFKGTKNGAAVQETVQIKVFGKPSPKFSITSASMGCVGLPVSFKSESTGGGGTSITKLDWTFGDGGGNSGTNTTPTWTYNLAGTFDVTLIVTDANGCDSSVVLKNAVRTSIPPNPVITSNPSPASTCVPPLNVTFSGTSSTSNSTTGSAALTYLWNFGNGSPSSTSATPSQQTYTNVGNYTATLTVTDNNNCSKSTTAPVSVKSYVASFSSPASVCKNTPVTFTNVSNAETYVWDFGDGTISYASSPSHSYSAGGTYTIKLTATSNGCTDDFTQNIFVEDVKANFTSSPTYGCNSPLVVNFNNTSTSNASATSPLTYQWKFGNNNTSTTPNPTNSYYNLDKNPYTRFKEPVYFTDTLIVTSQNGCKDTKVIYRNDTLQPITARFVPDTSEGCARTVILSDSSISKHTIIERIWDYGDNTQLTGTNNTSTSHYYGTPGIYYPYLIIKNSIGCIDTSFLIPIKVGKAPNPDFAISSTSICIGDTLTLTDLTPAGDNVDTWHYSTVSNSGAPAECFNGTGDVKWVFFSGVGSQNIVLKAGSNGCFRTSAAKNINVKGPLSNFSFELACSKPNEYTFIGDITGEDQFEWKFGDATSNTTNKTVTKTYTTPGTYTVVLTSRNSGCTRIDSDTLVVKVGTLDASFLINGTNKDTVCAGATVKFDASASTNVGAACNSGYFWDFGDGQGPRITSSSTFDHSYATGGLYNVKLFVKDENGCSDTVSRQIRVSSITAAVTSNSNFGCLDPDWAVTFFDKSTSDATITGWVWKDYKNGIVQNIQNPSWTITSPGPFTVYFQATNKFGCKSAEIPYTVQPSVPIAAFNESNPIICEGDSVSFNPTGTIDSRGTYYWEFGDGQSITAVTPTHTYSTEGIYSVTLILTDSVLCRDTLIKNDLVTVNGKPKVGFVSSVDTMVAKCWDKQVFFIDTSYISPLSTLKKRIWDLDTDNEVIGSDTVFQSYTKPGTYYISLVVESQAGCIGSARDSIRLEGPVADFDMSKTAICKGESITFTIKDSSDVASYSWDFGDGNIIDAISPVTHQYTSHFTNAQGTSNVILTVKSGGGKCPVSISQQIAIQKVVADFNRNNESLGVDTAHCIGTRDTLYNNSTNINGETWKWSLDNGVTFDNANVSPLIHQFTAAGIYNIKLAIESASLGCKDTITKQMVIYNTPIIDASGGSICLDKSLQLNASGGTTYSWSPATGLSDPTLANPVASPTETITYTVNAEDASGCKGSKEVTVVVHQKIPQVGKDTAIVIGQQVVLNTGFGDQYTYSWTPTEGLSCTTCPNPTATTSVTKTYTVEITDKVGCFESTADFIIEIIPKSSVAVPSAFTPNGDGINDIIYVRGWGIKKLLEFNIYNRWGQLIYTSTDINQGWDGTFQGVLQNVETYIYTVKVETFIDKEPLSTKGYIDLLK